MGENSRKYPRMIPFITVNITREGRLGIEFTERREKKYMQITPQDFGQWLTTARYSAPSALVLLKAVVGQKRKFGLRHSPPSAVLGPSCG